MANILLAIVAFSKLLKQLNNINSTIPTAYALTNPRVPPKRHDNAVLSFKSDLTSRFLKIPIMINNTDLTTKKTSKPTNSFKAISSPKLKKILATLIAMSLMLPIPLMAFIIVSLKKTAASKPAKLLSVLRS